MLPHHDPTQRPLTPAPKAPVPRHPTTANASTPSRTLSRTPSRTLDPPFLGSGGPSHTPRTRLLTGLSPRVSAMGIGTHEPGLILCPSRQRVGRRTRGGVTTQGLGGGLCMCVIDTKGLT